MWGRLQPPPHHHHHRSTQIGCFQWRLSHIVYLLFIHTAALFCYISGFPLFILFILTCKLKIRSDGNTLNVDWIRPLTLMFLRLFLFVCLVQFREQIWIKSAPASVWFLRLPWKKLNRSLLYWNIIYLQTNKPDSHVSRLSARFSFSLNQTRKRSVVIIPF